MCWQTDTSTTFLVLSQSMNDAFFQSLNKMPLIALCKLEPWNFTWLQCHWKTVVSSSMAWCLKTLHESLLDVNAISSPTVIPEGFPQSNFNQNWRHQLSHHRGAVVWHAHTLGVLPLILWVACSLQVDAISQFPIMWHMPPDVSVLQSHPSWKNHVQRQISKTLHVKDIWQEIKQAETNSCCIHIKMLSGNERHMFFQNSSAGKTMCHHCKCPGWSNLSKETSSGF